METNNLTPDENLKEPIYFNKDEEPVKTYDTVEAPGVSFGDAVVHPDYIPGDGIALTGALVYVLVCIGALAIIAILFFLMYFK